MAYIPKKHKKYNLLPNCIKFGGEVFSYPSALADELDKYIPLTDTLIPYGYKSYQEYLSKIDEYISQYADDEQVMSKFVLYKDMVCQMNVKENWSVLRYLGHNISGLTNGRVYYWPCSEINPIYEGVVDDEEFTSYIYSTASELWEILEDPTGMAYKTIYSETE